jgi:hypothetical protein
MQSTFNGPFNVSTLHMPSAPRTYRVTCDDKLTEGFSDIAFRRTGRCFDRRLGASGDTARCTGVDSMEGSMQPR